MTNGKLGTEDVCYRLLSSPKHFLQPNMHMISPRSEIMRAGVFAVSQVKSALAQNGQHAAIVFEQEVHGADVHVDFGTG